MHNFGSEESPRFDEDRNGKTITVPLGVKWYVGLLVRANVTDVGAWPPELQKGAAAFARVRQIELDCLAREGEFDWDKLPAAEQDEYDRLCTELDELLDGGESIPWKQFKAGSGEVGG